MGIETIRGQQDERDGRDYRKLFRRAKESDLRSLLGHTVLHVANRKVADKDQVIRAPWVLTWKSSGRANELIVFFGDSGPGHLTKVRSTFSTSRSVGFATGCVKQSEAGVRRHQDDMLVGGRGMAQHVHLSTRRCATHLGVQTRVDAKTSQSGGRSLERTGEIGVIVWRGRC